ncbi:MAG: VWA domain-containing protein [Terriglobia bacterium]
MKRILPTLALACGMVWQAVVALAQSPPAEGSPGAAPVDDASQEYSFSVDIKVVTVPVTVTDPKGEFVTDLDVNDFTILDNGVPQKIESFDLSLEPLSLAILVETSSRIQSLLPEIRNTGILFTQLIVGETGEAAVIGFDSELKLLQDFTSDPERVEAAFRNLTPGGDPVRLSDAVGRGVFLLARRPEDRRKVIIILSEARDQGSSSSHGAVLRGAQQLGISVYAVGLSSLRGMLGRTGEGVSSPFPPGVSARPMPANQPPTPDAQTGWGAANVNLLALIAELVSNTKNLVAGNPLSVFAAGTGGQDFASGGKEQMEKALGRIGQELRNQYILTYRPNNLDEPGYHSIGVAVSRPSLEVRTRLGYVFVQPIRRRPAAPALQPPRTTDDPAVPSGQRVP